MLKHSFVDDDYSKDNDEIVKLVYTQGKSKYLLKFVDYSIKDERSSCWSNRNLWIFRKPIDIFKVKSSWYTVISEKFMAPPSVHIKFNMGLNEDISGYEGDGLSTDTISKISVYEQSIFKRV